MSSREDLKKSRKAKDIVNMFYDDVPDNEYSNEEILNAIKEVIHDEKGIQVVRKTALMFAFQWYFENTEDASLRNEET